MSRSNDFPLFWGRVGEREEKGARNKVTKRSGKDVGEQRRG